MSSSSIPPLHLTMIPHHPITPDPDYSTPTLSATHHHGAPYLLSGPSSQSLEYALSCHLPTHHHITIHDPLGPPHLLSLFLHLQTRLLPPRLLSLPAPRPLTSALRAPTTRPRHHRVTWSDLDGLTAPEVTATLSHEAHIAAQRADATKARRKRRRAAKEAQRQASVLEEARRYPDRPLVLCPAAKLLRMKVGEHRLRKIARLNFIACGKVFAVKGKFASVIMFYARVLLVWERIVKEKGLEEWEAAKSGGRGGNVGKKKRAREEQQPELKTPKTEPRLHDENKQKATAVPGSRESSPIAMYKKRKLQRAREEQEPEMKTPKTEPRLHDENKQKATAVPGSRESSPIAMYKKRKLLRAQLEAINPHTAAVNAFVPPPPRIPLAPKPIVKLEFKNRKNMSHPKEAPKADNPFVVPAPKHRPAQEKKKPDGLKRLLEWAEDEQQPEPEKKMSNGLKRLLEWAEDEEQPLQEAKRRRFVGEEEEEAFETAVASKRKWEEEEGEDGEDDGIVVKKQRGSM